MRLGQFLAGFTVLSALLAGGAMYYLQVYAFYEEIAATGDDVHLVSFVSGEPEPILYENFQAIDADSSPIRYRVFHHRHEPFVAIRNLCALRKGRAAQRASLV
jgi:hypothetical protein